MKKIVGLLTVGLLSSIMASEFISATKVSNNLKNISPNSRIWNNASFNNVTLYPQTALKFNDKEANKENDKSFSKVAKIGAVYNKNDIAFLIKWADGTKSVQSGTKVREYADSFAVQFPVNYSDNTKLPYIGMGSKDRPVVVHLQKAVKKHYEPNGNGDIASQVSTGNTNHFEKDLKRFNKNVDKLAVKDYQKAFVSEGFRSMTEIKDSSSKFSARMLYRSKKWKGTLTRPLKDSYINLKQGSAFPVAFAIWDGDKKNRDGLKLLSSWVPVKLKNNELAKTYSTLNSLVDGDIENGKKLVLENCAFCHTTPNSAGITPNDYTAPNLNNIGGCALVSYIKESIVNPSAVIVAGYNRNYHPTTPWYSVDKKGNRVSSMPSYSWMSEKDINDMTAFLQTAKKGVK